MRAHRASLLILILPLSVTNLVNPQMLFSCGPWGVVRVPLWNSSLFWNSSHLGWAMALKTLLPSSPQEISTLGEPLQSPALFICWWDCRKISRNAGYYFSPSRKFCLAPVLNSEPCSELTLTFWGTTNPSIWGHSWTSPAAFLFLFC